MIVQAEEDGRVGGGNKGLRGNERKKPPQALLSLGGGGGGGGSFRCVWHDLVWHSFVITLAQVHSGTARPLAS